MSTIEAGTRTWANQMFIRPTSRHFDRSATRDLGMSKRAVGALVFDAVAKTVTLAGAFAAFAYNDQILVEGTASNNGFFTVTATGTNALTLDPPPTTETTPATAVLRSA